MQLRQQPLELRRIRLPIPISIGTHGRTTGRSLILHHVFHIPVPGDEFKNMLACSLSKFGAQVNVLPEIIDSRDQAFQNERGFVAGHHKLTGVIGQTTALKERKRHFGRLNAGECRDCTPVVHVPLGY